MTIPRLGVRLIDHMSLLVRMALATAALGLAPAQSFAASQADEDACRPDVFRLCMAAIPDENAIVACLNDHIRALSPACRLVIDPSQPPASHAPRRRLSAP